jgi:hypothetical protein
MSGTWWTTKITASEVLKGTGIDYVDRPIAEVL